MNTATPALAADAAPAQLAKAALRRLALAKLEPTPENYARAYQLEQGGAVAPSAAAPGNDRVLKVLEQLAGRVFEPAGAAALARAAAQGTWDEADRLAAAPDGAGAQLADMVAAVVRGIENPSREWTLARRKESLQRVLAGSRGDAARLRQRLLALVGSWNSGAAEADAAAGVADTVDNPPDHAAVDAPTATLAVSPTSSSIADPAGADPSGADPTGAAAAVPLGDTIGVALDTGEADARTLAADISAAASRVFAADAPADAVDALQSLCGRAQQLLKHRHHLVDQLGALCRTLTDSLVELSEEGSWAHGQCEAMRACVEDGLNARSVRSVNQLLDATRERQGRLRAERAKARDALKVLVVQLLGELDDLGSQTGRFHDSVGVFADRIESADSLESLTSLVVAMAEEGRAVQGQVRQARERLLEGQRRSTELTERVQALETELQKLSDQVVTDQLTQVANRRGLLQAFEAELTRLVPDGPPLSVGLLDIDNFKRLNDELGHAAGDEALKALAARVSAILRPGDTVARYGGEEFVLLLPRTTGDEAREVLTRLQRAMTSGLFMHEKREVLVTFSAGVTVLRKGEPLEAALERADQALYQAKRTGKNRTCSA